PQTRISLPVQNAVAVCDANGARGRAVHALVAGFHAAAVPAATVRLPVAPSTAWPLSTTKSWPVHALAITLPSAGPCGSDVQWPVTGSYSLPCRPSGGGGPQFCAPSGRSHKGAIAGTITRLPVQIGAYTLRCGSSGAGPAVHPPDRGEYAKRSSRKLMRW